MDYTGSITQYVLWPVLIGLSYLIVHFSVRYMERKESPAEKTGKEEK